MENKKYIKDLLVKYYEGESSLEEELYLRNLLLSEEKIASELEEDRKVFRLIHADHIPLPEGFEQRLEQHIDKHILLTKHSKKRASFVWISSVAASLILALTLFKVLLPTQTSEQQLRDSFSDPKEAAMLAQNTLFYISTELNKGLSGIEKTQDELMGLHQTLNKLADLLIIAPHTTTDNGEHKESE